MGDHASLAEIWQRRDNKISCHYCLDYALDSFIDLIFAVNKSFVLQPKWKLNYRTRLDWLPDGFEQALERALLCTSLDLAETRRIQMALCSIWMNCV